MPHPFFASACIVLSSSLALAAGPELTGTWNVVFKEGKTNTCDFPTKTAATQWLVAQNGELTEATITGDTPFQLNKLSAKVVQEGKKASLLVDQKNVLGLLKPRFTGPFKVGALNGHMSSLYGALDVDKLGTAFGGTLLWVVYKHHEGEGGQSCLIALELQGKKQ